MNESLGGTSPAVEPAKWSRTDVAYAIFIAAFIYLQLFILPLTPVYVEGDQLLPVSNAMRILNGEVMYRDFFHISPPGAEYYYATLFSVFGIKIWVLSATVFLLAIGQLLLLIALSKQILEGIYVYLPGLLYFVIGFRPYGIDGSFRLFSVVFVLSAALVVSRKRTPTLLFAAGALCGIASFFVQTRGLLGIGAIGLFLLWTHFRQGIKFRALLRDWLCAGGSFLLVIVLTQIYPASAGGFDNYFFANVTFVKDHYRSDTLSNFLAYFTDLPSLKSYVETYGTGHGLFRYFRVSGPTLFVYLIVPLCYVVYLAFRKLRSVDPSKDEKLVLLSLLGIVLYIGVSAPTALRLYHISIPAVIVLVWIVQNVIRKEFAAKVTALGLTVLAIAYSGQRQTAVNLTRDLPAGDAAFLSPVMAEKYQWLAERTDPGDALYEAQHPTFYFPLHLRNPTPFYLVRDNNYTPDFQIKSLMAALESSKPRFIIWHGGWSKEATERLPGDNLAPLWDFVRENYELEKEFVEFGEYTTNSERDIEIWRVKQ